MSSSRNVRCNAFGVGLYSKQAYMNPHQTASTARVTERQKAWARLALLTVVGLVCPPLAAAKSGVVWPIYLALAVLYGLWTVHATRGTSRDRLLGYLLCVTDAIVLLPILVWSIGVAMRVVLGLLWLVGVATSWRADCALQQQKSSKAPGSRARGASRDVRSSQRRPQETGPQAPLERALRVRLRVMAEERTRFALVLLRIERQQELVDEFGAQGTRDLLREVGRRGLRLLGPDAQLFLLPGGRTGFRLCHRLVQRTGRGQQREGRPAA